MVAMVAKVQQTQAARILIAVPIGTKSHNNFFVPIAEHLVLISLVRLPDWLYYLGHVIVYRYASAVLHEQAFFDRLTNLPMNGTVLCPDNNAEYGCRYRNGTYYLLERYHFPENGLDHGRQDLDLWSNFGLSFAFFGGMLVLNLVLYLVPLPSFIKSKFRD